MPTTGGATVSLVGRNFGPELFHGVALDVVRVTYGRTEATVGEFECASATIKEDSVRIECVPVAGIGAPLHWRVGVGVVPQSDNPTLYSEPMKEVDSGSQPPSIAGVSAPLLDTKGGSR